MEKKFFVDAMLGSLARWMRTLGYDVLYEAHIDDTALLLKAAADGRAVQSLTSRADAAHAECGAR